MFLRQPLSSNVLSKLNLLGLTVYVDKEDITSPLGEVKLRNTHPLMHRNANTVQTHTHRFPQYSQYVTLKKM